MALTVGTFAVLSLGSPLFFLCGPIAGGTGAVNARLYRALDNAGTPGTFVAVTGIDPSSLIADGNSFLTYSQTDLLTGSYWFKVVATDTLVSVSSSQILIPQTAPTLMLSSARRKIRFFARHAGDKSYYPTEMLDYALQRASAELVQRAKLLLRTDTFDTVATQNSYTLSMTRFRPDRIKEMFLTGANVTVNAGPFYSTYPDASSEFTVGGPDNFFSGPMYRTATLNIVDQHAVSDATIATGQTGQPTMIAFTTPITLNLYPNPDQVYTVNVRWWDFFSEWEPGVALASATLGSANFVSSLTLIDGSDHYTAAPTVTLVGGTTDVAATATANITADGAVGTLTLSSSGSGYTTAPTVYFNGFAGADVTFNLPTDYMTEIVSLGTPCYMQFNEPEQGYAKQKRDDFEAFIRRIIGNIGGLGAQSVRPVRRR